MTTCKKIKSGYAGQRYQVSFEDADGKRKTMGWTERADGEPLVGSINAHPVWKNPQVFDLQTTKNWNLPSDAEPENKE